MTKPETVWPSAQSNGLGGGGDAPRDAPRDAWPFTFMTYNVLADLLVRLTVPANSEIEAPVAVRHGCVHRDRQFQCCQSIM